MRRLRNLIVGMFVAIIVIGGALHSFTLLGSVQAQTVESKNAGYVEFVAEEQFSAEWGTLISARQGAGPAVFNYTFVGKDGTIREVSFKVKVNQEGYKVKGINLVEVNIIVIKRSS